MALQESSAWIFQGNPAKFNISDYLRERFESDQTILWSVSQYVDHISQGDTVYFWRSGQKEPSGVIARAVVVELPSIQENDAPAYPEKGSPGAIMRCRLKLLELRLTPGDGMVTRATVKSDPILASHTIVTAGQKTNFALSLDHLQSLNRLWGITPDDDLIKEDILADDSLDSFSAQEGWRVLKVHLHRERNKVLVEEAKSRFRAEHGRLYCEACGFDFADAYGSAASDFIEAHHNLPISHMEEGATTQVEDLSMLCSNCHRVIHLRRPWLSVQQLRTIVLSQRNDSPT